MNQTRERRGPRALAGSPICSGAGPGLAEGIFGPARRHPALPTGLPWDLQNPTGRRSPKEKIWICLWGGRGLKYSRMEDYHIFWTLDHRALGEVTSASKHFASAHRCKGYYNDRQQWRHLFQVAQIYTECFEHTTIISVRQIANRGIRWVDILQIYLLQFSKLGWFLKFRARVCYYLQKWYDWKLTAFDSCQLMLGRTEFMCLLLVSRLHNYCVYFINLMK